MFSHSRTNGCMNVFTIITQRVLSSREKNASRMEVVIGRMQYPKIISSRCACKFEVISLDLQEIYEPVIQGVFQPYVLSLSESNCIAM